MSFRSIAWFLTLFLLLASVARAELTPGLHSNEFLLQPGLVRLYDVLVPASYDGSTDVPLVIDLHGFSRTKQFQRSMSGFQALAEAEGFIAVWPQGVDTTWNAGFPCTSSATVDDVGFMRGIVAAIAAQNRIDPARVYVTGQSCGGGMTHRLACEAADLFAAAAPFGWPGPRVTCTPSRPIPILMTHSIDDAYVLYDGGHLKNDPNLPIMPGVHGGFDEWRVHDGCTASDPEVTEYPAAASTCERYVTCSGGSEVELCSVHTDPNDGFLGHYAYSPETLDDFDTEQWAWDFLSSFTLDRDGDTVLDPADNCPTVANADQAESDSDSVGDACDNCRYFANPRVADDYLANNPWATLTGGQRDDDHDGYGNKCDADFTPAGLNVGTLDVAQYNASSGKSRVTDTCGTAGTLPCAIFDLDEGAGLNIGTPDRARLNALIGLPAGGVTPAGIGKCPTCPLTCVAGSAGTCN